MTVVGRIVVVMALVGCGSRPGAPPANPPPGPSAPPPIAPTLALIASGLRGVDLTPPVNVTSLPSQVPGYAATDSVEYAENSPDFPVATFCLTRRGGACDLVLFPDRDGVIDRIRVLDPDVPGPGGTRVGQGYREQPASFERCHVLTGVEFGMSCAVRGADNIEAWFALPDLVPSDSETPSPAVLDRARVTHLWWWLPGT